MFILAVLIKTACNSSYITEVNVFIDISPLFNLLAVRFTAKIQRETKFVADDLTKVNKIDLFIYKSIQMGRRSQQVLMKFIVSPVSSDDVTVGSC